VLVEVQRWLEEDRKRRETDSRRQGISADAMPSRQVMASQAVARARVELQEPALTYRAAALLRWVTVRFGSTPAGQQAEQLLKEIKDDPMIADRLSEQGNTAARRLSHTRAQALQKVGQIAEARRAWSAVARLADSPALRLQAAQQVQRLARQMARTPYLGLKLEGDSTVVRSVTPGGPAHRAGLRAGDRLEKVGARAVANPDAVRRQLELHKPGEEMEVVVARGKRSLTLEVRVGAMPVQE
jgi:C-terminal processing protease CtpA/Prc